MLLKKTPWISACNSLYNCNLCAPHLSCSKTSPSSYPAPGTRQRQQHPPQSPCRTYATTRDKSGPDFRDNMNWPCRNASAPVPTPYEIFELERGAIYSKHRYYELVKLYHPDKSAHSQGDDSLSHVERLERYRLVVQAHEILSDPVKRRAYDAYGAGWIGRSTATRHSKGYTNGSGQKYGYGPDNDASVFGNATWEDWERWYRTRSGDSTKQAYAGTYINPNAFASFVILMAVLTGVIQATRAGQYSTSLGEKAQAFTEETNQFMMARAQTLTENKLGSDGRVKHFLERRDPSRYGLKDDEEMTYRQHFSDDQIMPGKTTPKPET